MTSVVLPSMDIPTQAFTTTASQRVLELKNEVQVAKAFNPDNDPFPTRLHTYTAVWDTGATHSMISTKVVEGVGLSPSGKPVSKSLDRWEMRTRLRLSE